MSCDASSEGSGSDDERSFQRQEPGPSTSAKKTRKPLSSKHLEAHNEEADNRGIAYISYIPPKMKANKLRTLLTKHGAEILRVYLAPEDSMSALRRKKSGGKRGKRFTEGWIEFADKQVAKRLAGSLNGTDMGGKHFSTHRYDLWNLKYLKHFKWDNLTAEIAYQKAVREQKLAAELRNAKRERDSYLARVDKAHAIDAMEERKAKKAAAAGGVADGEAPRKVMRSFKQRGRRDDGERATDSNEMDLGVLASVFGGK